MWLYKHSTGNNYIFRLVTITAFLGLLLPVLVTDGMFMDGLIYAAISKNMAHGTGSFWSPHLTDTLQTQFFDHPPLVFGIQSIFFKIFGDGFWVERLYSFLTAVIMAAIISKIWKALPGNKYAKLSWLPVFLWLAIPLVRWSYTNNMMENTMSIFSALAFLFLLIGTGPGRSKLPWIMAAALMIDLAFLCNGFTGVFPYAFFGIHWLVLRNYSFSRMLLYTLLLVTASAILFVPLLFYSPSRHALESYIQQQVLSGIEGHRDAIDRTFILSKLAMELSIVAVITAALFFIGKKKNIEQDQQVKRTSLFLILVALSGSLPIVISLKQSGYYALPSLPFYALGAAALIVPTAHHLISQIDIRSFRYRMFLRITQAAIAGICVICVFRFGKPGRDEDKLHDIKVIGSEVPPGIMRTTQDLWMDWTLHGYLMRYDDISIDDLRPHAYFLCRAAGDTIPRGYSEVKLPLKVYRLFKAAR
jgi:4-amino-4-deoxy-L-arabinose transferase-like glycosyltransferase